MLTMIPKCTECDEEGVYYSPAHVFADNTKTWFSIWMCPKCQKILRCAFAGSTEKKIVKRWVKDGHNKSSKKTV